MPDPSTPRRWWAVWDPEYPDEGSVHVRAATRAEAIRQAVAADAFPKFEDDDEQDLAAEAVSAEVHAEWEQSGD